MKVLMISSDRNIANRNSAVAGRMIDYGTLVEELHIVLLSDKAHELENVRLGMNVFVYVTNSSSRYARPRDAAALGISLVSEKKFVRGQALITTQDPFECGLAGLKIKKHWRLPLEVQLHTDPFSKSFTGFLNFLRKRIARKVLQKADSVRVVTEDLARKISAEYHLEGKTFVLPIFVDPTRIENKIISFDLHQRFGWKVILLSVARLTKEKNIALGVEALALALPQIKDTGLVIVGEGPERKNLEGLAKRLKIEPFVAFVGWQEDLAPYYGTADIFLQTSAFEGYGLSLVEAGLSGLSVITTPVGIARELKPESDLLVVAPEKQAVAEAIKKLATNVTFGKQFNSNLKQTLESKLMSKEEYLKKLKENWEKILLKV
jgi:glycosyltransferase involved in cell wall biosynthesis